VIGLDQSYYEPVFYADEHYLSVFKRWSFLGGSGQLPRGIKMLADINIWDVRTALQPKFLQAVINALPEQFDKEVFLESHTQECFYKTIYKSAESTFYTDVQRVGALLLNNHLRWCPACAQEDMQSLGTTYWRNSHQDSRLLRCQRHQLKLISTCHLCKRKKVSLNGLMPPKIKPECSLCSKTLSSHRVTALNPFQQWLEKLHHLGRHGVQVDREILLAKISTIIDASSQQITPSTKQRHQSPNKRFIDAYNQNKVYENTGTGEVPYEIIASWSQLQIKNVLNAGVVYPPEIYALLGWEFLDHNDRESLFGTFRNGEATKEVVCQTFQ
jgi:hypothetical protein